MNALQRLLCLTLIPSGSETGPEDGEGRLGQDEDDDRLLQPGGGRGLPRGRLAHRDLAGGTADRPEEAGGDDQHLQQLQVRS